MVVLANAFAEAGWQAHLVLAQATGDYLSEVSAAVQVVDLNSTRVLSSLPRLVRYLRAEEPVALISGMPHVNVVALGAKLLAGTSTVVILTEHIDRSGAGRRSLRGRALDKVASIAYRFADHVVGVSEGVSDDVARVFRLPRERVRTIYNPVDVATVAARANEPIVLPWGADAPSPLIVAVGRLVQQKDVETLLRAFALLLPQRDSRLAVIGDGPRREDLESLARDLQLADRVHFAGFQSNPYSWMRRADLFVLSSRYEGLGNVLIEAMACGTPVVSTDCPSGPREILEDGRWGRLVSPGNPDELAAAMIASLSDSEPPNVSKRAADFAPERAVERYANLIGKEK
jgi:glycosyltransferase involved in cell wall biosynthesis